MGKPVVHFEIVGKNAATLNSFYGSLFDWQIDTNNPIGYGMISRDDNLNPDGAGIGGGIMGTGGVPEMADYPGHVTFYVEVPDVEAALQQAESLGGKRMMGPDEVPGGPILGQFTDPEGHLIGLVQESTG